MVWFFVVWLPLGFTWGGDFRAGSARVDITPGEPIWMAGFAARNRPSEGVATRLWAKALAVEDGSRGKAVIVTTDLIGLSRNISETVAARVAQQYGLPRSRLLLNSSHTHSGPVVKANLMTMYFLTPEQQAAVDRYASRLVENLVTVIGAAIADLSPARLSVAHGQVGFAMNRRTKFPPGPVDHDVPVLAVRTPDGKLKAVLFGYACHNTTLLADYVQINGDYAGYAQTEVEAAQPGVTALFLMLCGGDANPSPRGTLADAERHGRTLAAEVLRQLAGPMKPIKPSLRSAWQTIDLAFQPHSREQFEQEAKSENRYLASRARAMLRAYDERRPLHRISYPVQAIRLGKDFTILALGGEVVAGYGLRAKREFAPADLIVAGYSNDVMCYIPTRTIVREGGYEGADSMIYYGLPGPLTEDVEETIFQSIRTVLRRIGLKILQTGR
ncbi:MAG: neutral/alkaline non-lysosomal ceramidase N-terminal domain-containing protein [Bryobacteraceae bacterium]|nr:neutral/alkaline non-lysosomal ceramidase N-terminal domain-containing protein [Bryobacteraceae bacterium]MDW8376656.1 neutral/alkaline non-lysosomal ceramidase N-terminal domain-containing protein [Bryobacterales bacterium]